MDANVFIYAIVKSPKKDFAISHKILESIEHGEESVTSTAVIQEVIKWLEYNNRIKEVKIFLTAVNSYLSMDKLNGEWDNFLPTLDDMYGKQISFVDSLTLQLMKQHKITEIYSNDKDFDRIEWVKRVWE